MLSNNKSQHQPTNTYAVHMTRQKAHSCVLACAQLFKKQPLAMLSNSSSQHHPANTSAIHITRQQAHLCVLACAQLIQEEAAGNRQPVDEPAVQPAELSLAQIAGAVVAQEVPRDAVVVEVVGLAQVAVLGNACRNVCRNVSRKGCRKAAVRMSLMSAASNHKQCSVRRHPRV
jgi:hypothetical protein